ncbi:hypothetical protein L3Q82_007309 [Scortum barcoo]|uniref:Uncharacterized protein n=1 Tax=Scortum barcoo TaxID=214431 RepID=A0ACB8WSF4_9TELE|nr:hypothetical protein L3Q82_007309 [Scortum barcoo]
MPPGRLPREVFQACPTGRRPREKTQDTLERLCLSTGLGTPQGIPPEELEEVSGIQHKRKMKLNHQWSLDMNLIHTVRPGIKGNLVQPDLDAILINLDAGQQETAVSVASSSYHRDYVQFKPAASGEQRTLISALTPSPPLLLTVPFRLRYSSAVLQVAKALSAQEVSIVTPKKECDNGNYRKINGLNHCSGGYSYKIVKIPTLKSITTAEVSGVVSKLLSGKERQKQCP